MTRVRTLQETWPDRFGGLPQEVVEYALSKAAWERQTSAPRVE
jgi:hypothetical protein